MGIQRFGLRMRNYAVRSTLGSTESPATNSIAIIDGPGLAHHVFYQLCDKHGSGNISYAACVEAAKKWVKDLQSIGFKVDAILFDGALPVSKKDVRIGRLQGYIDRVQAYKQSTGSALPTISGQARKSLPPPPFLVFAIVEELLLDDEFSGVTYVVPGEADPYCVAAAQSMSEVKDDTTIAIFSDDSDLLVYALGQRTTVVPFRDLSESQTTAGISWTCEQYWPAEIAGRGANPLGDLIRPAYLMAQDPFCPLDKALRAVASSDPASKADFDDFARTFQTTQEVEQWAKIKVDPKAKARLASRDSRISELMYQLQSNEADQGGLRMYLPFISDDPAKKTAWSLGVNLRSLAYSVLLRSTGSDTSIQEYRRSGVRIASTSVEPLTKEQTTQQTRELATHIKSVLSWIAESTKLDKDNGWRYLTMQHALSSLQADGYPLPVVDDLTQVVMQRQSPKWHLIHLSGQLQAVYYSLRMLKQVLVYVVEKADDRKSPELDSAVELNHQLDELPRISTFFSECGTEELAWRSALCDLLSSLQPDSEDAQDRPRKKQKKSKKSKTQSQSQPAALEQNPFAMLAGE